MISVITCHGSQSMIATKPDKEKGYRWMRSEESINTLKNELLEQNWDKLYRERDIGTVCETFLMIFRSLYDKNYPIKEYSRKQKYIHCPWITKGVTVCFLTHLFSVLTFLSHLVATPCLSLSLCYTH